MNRPQAHYSISTIRVIIKKCLVLFFTIAVILSSSPEGFVSVFEHFFLEHSDGIGKAYASVNAASKQYIVDIGPITASTSANYVYTSIFNPSGSGRSIAIKHLAIRSETASSTASNYVNLTVRRITAASIGTQIATTNIPKKNSSSSDSIAEIRYNGPTVTLAGTVDSRILGQPLSGAVGAFFSQRDILFGSSDEKIVLQPGEGIAIYQEAAGALSTKARVLLEWEETANAPLALGEFLFAFPRVAAAATQGYVYNSFFNPSSSGKTAIVKRIWFGTETCSAAAIYTNKISIRRTTAASAGTAIATTNIPKKNTSSSDSVMDIRHTNATSTLVGTADARIASVTPCGGTGESQGWQKINFDSNDEKLILQQGEGIALIAETPGSANQVVRMIVEWQEVSSAATPSSQGEYMWASSAVQAAVATTTHYTFFNPVGSGMNVLIKRLSIRVDATTTGAFASYSFRRLSAASGGTQITASDLQKKHTGSGTSAMEVRWCGAGCASAITTTYTGAIDARLFSVTSPGAVGQSIGQKEIVFGSNEDIVLAPGEGIGLYNEILTSSTGDAVRVFLEWKEQAASPTSQGEYLLDVGPVTGTTTATYTYATFFNPVGSGKTAVLKRIHVRVDAIAAAVYVPVQLRRLTAASAGVQIASTTVPKKNTGSATTSMEIRYGAPGVTGTITTTYSGTTDSKLLAVQTPGAVGSNIAGNTGYKEIIFSPNEQIILQPGEGVGLYGDTSAGSANHRVRILFEWGEVTTANTPASLGEYLMTTGPIAQNAAANYVYATLFNPSGSAKNFLVKRIAMQIDRNGAASTTAAYTPVSVRRITSASAGTLAATSSILKHMGSASSSAEVRTTNVTASFSGVADSRLLGVTTPGVVNQMFGDYESLVTQGDEFVLVPGEGIALYQEQATGDALVAYRFALEWQEASNAAAPQTISFSISTSTIYFGTVSSAVTRYASSTNTTGSNSEVEAHTFSVTTNATNGYTVVAKGQTLTSGTTTIAAIGNTSTTSQAGTEQFGIRITASGGSGTSTSPYNSTGFAYSGTATTSTQVASASIGDGVATIFSVRYLVNVAPITQPAVYTANIVYVATANF
jgi:hypothetical protein